MTASWRGLMADQMGWTGMDEGWRKGPWTTQEDRLLIDYVKQQGDGRWNSVSRLTGLRRNGKSCRLRWVNYLRPDLKRGHITPQEEKIIQDMHSKWGNRWSTIARSLPGRTDNEIKNYWRTHFKKKTVTSTDNMETLRARLLRKQQFQLQQQLQLQQQRQGQEHEFSQFDMKKITSLLEENNDNRVVPTSSLPQITTTSVMYPNTINNGDQEQGLFYSMPRSDNFRSHGSNDKQPEHQQQDMLWDGLWNMEDLQGNFSAFCATSYQANFLPHFVAPSY